MRVFFSITFFLSVSLIAFAQSSRINVRGIVLDAETGSPLPYASVYIENTTIGSITNINGNFDLHLAGQTSIHLTASFVGYSKKKIILNASDTTVTIALNPEAKMLRELVITPNDTIAEFVQACYKSINANYVTHEYELEAFYRESSRDKNNHYHYFGEAKLQVQGSGYQYVREDGKVKVVQSRVNYFNDSVPTFYYGGPFIGCSGDVVKRRKSFLSGDASKYDYSLVRSYKTPEGETCVISFTSKKTGSGGELYIDKQSKAFIRIEIELKDDEKNGKQIVSYTQWKNKWYVNLIHADLTRKNKKLNETEITSVDFAVTSIATDSISDIPLAEQLMFGQPFATIKNNFKEDFWRGKSTIPPDSLLRSQTRSFTRPERTPVKNNKAVNLISRLGINLGLQLLPYSVKSTSVGLEVLAKDGQSIPIKSQQQPDVSLVYKGGISFRVKNATAINFTYSESLSKVNLFRSSQIGFIYSFQLPTRGNPLLLRTSLGLNYQIFGQGFSSLPKSTEIQFKNHVYDYSKMKIFLGEKNYTAQLGVFLEKKLKGMKWIFIGTSYQYSISSTQQFFLRKESGLIKKIHSASLDASNITLTTPYSRPRLNPFLVEVGLRWKL